MDGSQICDICNKPLDCGDDSTVVVRENGLQTMTLKSGLWGDDKGQCWANSKTKSFHTKCRKRYTAIQLPRKRIKLQCDQSSSTNFSQSTSSPSLQMTEFSSSGSQPISAEGSSLEHNCRPTQPSTLEASSSTLHANVDSSSQPTTPISGHSSSFQRPQNSTSEHRMVAKRFEFNSRCIFCAKTLRGPYVSVITKPEFVSRIIQVARGKKTSEDKSVLDRIEAVSSLVDVKARYHGPCCNRFLEPEKDTKNVADSPTALAFNKLFDHIEKSGLTRFKLSELRKVMGGTAVELRTLNKHLTEKFGDDMYISHSRGKETTYIYKDDSIPKACRDWLGNIKLLTDGAKKCIVQKAAEIIRAEIMNKPYVTSHYPSPDKFLDNVHINIPPLVSSFFSAVAHGPRESHGAESAKEAAMSHSLISYVRPNVFISSLDIALGTYIHRKTGSRQIIDVLSHLGRCASYNDIRLYEASVILDPPQLDCKNTFLQFVYDNTDHNVQTLSGRDTFHNLGGIAAQTPHLFMDASAATSKLTKMPSTVEVANQKKITIVPYKEPATSGLKHIEYVSISSLGILDPPAVPRAYVTYLWVKLAKIPKIPSWRGFMEVLMREKSFDTSRITCLPFIHGPPSNNTTLYTALKNSKDECLRINQQTVFVTFDQPLYFKARAIVAGMQNDQDSPLKDVVVRLGGFHLLMSYLGAIGHVMGGSGLEDLWSVAYAPESVKKMMTGHSFSRSVRAHILTFTALGKVICDGIADKAGYFSVVENLFRNWSEQDERPLLSDLHNDRFQRMADAFDAELTRLETLAQQPSCGFFT